MATVPNQKIITVIKHKCDKNNLYSTINLKVKKEAAQNLDAGAFKLWNYFADNQSQYTFELSRTAVENTYGIKKKQYDKAIETLIAEKYLVRENENSNQYIFYEAPWLKDNKDAAWLRKDTTDKKAESATQCPKDTTRGAEKIPGRSAQKIQEIIQDNTLNNTINEDSSTAKPSGKPKDNNVSGKPKWTPPANAKVVKKPRAELEGNPYMYVLINKNTNKYYIDIFHQDNIIYEAEED